MTEFATADPSFRRVIELADRAAVSEASVLITGDSGTGKNRLARRVHDRSRRAAGPFVEVACANLSGELADSTLFGHERGAFTGAHETRIGRIEQADGGTLFLDELPELTAEVQAKVLRALDEQRFERVGGDETIRVDVRIVASTHENPAVLVRDGRLREDLFYRLNVVHLRLPPLRERADDVVLLARALLDDAVRRHGLRPLSLSEEAIARLRAYPWPGNVRELGHCIESAAVFAESGTIRLDDLPASVSSASPAMLQRAAVAGRSLRDVEDAYIDEVLRQTGGNKSEAARILGIHRKTLHERLRARGTGRRR